MTSRIVLIAVILSGGFLGYRALHQHSSPHDQAVAFIKRMASVTNGYPGHPTLASVSCSQDAVMPSPQVAQALGSGVRFVQCTVHGSDGQVKSLCVGVDSSVAPAGSAMTTPVACSKVAVTPPLGPSSAPPPVT
jgi:hypothetical protein